MPTSSNARCRIELLGGLRITWSDREPVRFSAQKTGALLARLARYSYRLHAREELIELLWPEVEPEKGRNRLKQTLSVIRAALEPDSIAPGAILVADRTTVRLNTDRLTTDVADFETACRHARETPNTSERPALLAKAVQTYTGMLLPGFFEDWILTDRDHLSRLYVEILIQLAGAFEDVCEWDIAVNYARKAVATDALCEDAHCALMRLYALQGRPMDSIRQFGVLEKNLAGELGEMPSAATLALVQSVRDGRMVTVVPPTRSRTRDVKLIADPHFLEPVGGAVPLASDFYIVRQTDHEFEAALARRDSIVLIKGPRQIGKTSLLARGLQQSRASGSLVVLTDLQRLTTLQMGSADSLFRCFADTIIEQLDSGVSLRDQWDPERGWNVNFERFLRREILGNTEKPLVWGLDEVDRLFPCDFSSEVFGLFRSWHNLRSLHPDGPWSRLTLAMSYATEAHLFITDLNQSPFNVGTSVTLKDFTLEQVAQLNRKYGSPLRDAMDLSRFFTWLGGCPYLVRRGLHEMVVQHLDIQVLMASPSQESGPFRDHLHRLMQLISRDTSLTLATSEVLTKGYCSDTESFYRLRSAGVMSGDSQSARLRCKLYSDFFQKHLS